jgi:predicted nucleotidyltransferase
LACSGSGAVRRELAQLDLVFVFGSVATGNDTAKGDVDLMAISEKVAYAELFAALEPATNRLSEL